MNAIREMIAMTEPPIRLKVEYDRLDWHLQNWRRWMQTGGKTVFHVGGGIGLQGFTHYDTDGEYDKSDTQTAIIVDAVIRGLAQGEQEALASEYLGAAWRRATPLHLVLVVARHGVQMGINRRGLV